MKKERPRPDGSCKNGSGIHLRELAEVYHPGITTHFGSVLAEAAAVCLDSQDHKNGVQLRMSGEFSALHPLIWEKVTDQMRRSYADEQVATEHGAYGIAVLIIDRHAGLKVVERSRKGTGFDLWLGTEDRHGPYFQNKARLEVSGIRTGNDSQLRRRVKEKLQQTTVSDKMKLPAFVAVTEFGTPRTEVVKKCSQ